MSDLQTSIERDARSKSKWPWLAGIAVVLVIAVGVGWFLLGRGQTASPATAASAAEPLEGGTLEFGMIDYQRTPDPHAGTNYAESIVANNITDKLTWQDPDTGEITPWLATSWEVNDDLTEFTFQLRDDVTFSDGSTFNAEVVKANFDQYVHGDAALGIKPNGAVLFPGYVETVVDDESTVTVRFDKPSASFLQATSFTANAQPGLLALSTLAKSAQERTDPKNVIGTGPFVYDEWTEQVRTVLVKREDYNWAPEAIGHDGAAYLDKIVFNVIPEASVRTGSLRSGDLDATLDVGTTDEALLADDGFELISRPVSGTAVLFNFNASLPPTNDIAVRQAIQLGWNRQAVEATVLSDSYSIATSVLADSVPGYRDHSDEALRYEPDRAAEILDDAGWVRAADGIREKDGKRLNVKLLAANILVASKPSFESIQQDLRELGIDLELSVLPIADYAASAATAATDFNVVAGNRSRNDPAVLNLQYNPLVGNATYLTPDFDGYDDLVDTLGKLELTLDPETREGYAADAQDALIEEYALVNPVYNPAQVIAHAPSVHGILFDAQSRNHFVDTWLSEQE